MTLTEALMLHQQQQTVGGKFGSWHRDGERRCADLVKCVIEPRYAPAGARIAELEAMVAVAACWCETCRPRTMTDARMILCPTCGNKRCPRATSHENDCTGSNEPGQPGSSYAPLLPAERTA